MVSLSVRFSFNQIAERTKPITGYGYAREMCEQSLRRLGHEVGFMDASADVEINFIQPQHWVWSGVDYRISFLPWESSQLPDGWLKAMNEVDEIWTPSSIIKNWYIDAGVKKPIVVYPHGVEPKWSPTLRTAPTHALHLGAESLRKGAMESYEAYARAVAQRDTALGFVFKTNNPQFNISSFGRINIVTEMLPIYELVEMFKSASVMISLSAGEGFGLPQLQALATGMPLIVTRGVLDYEHLVAEDLRVDSNLVDSPWPHIHPGKMFKPDVDSAVDRVLYYLDNYEQLHLGTYNRAFAIHKEYDWVKLTQRAISHLV